MKEDTWIRERVSWDDWYRLYDGVPVRDVLDADTTHAVSPAGDIVEVSDTEPPRLVQTGSRRS